MRSSGPASAGSADVARHARSRWPRSAGIDLRTRRARRCSPRSASAASRSRSSSVPTPPEAITGVRTARGQRRGRLAGSGPRACRRARCRCKSMPASGRSSNCPASVEACDARDVEPALRSRPARRARRAPGPAGRDKPRPSRGTRPGLAGPACPTMTRSRPASSQAAIVASSRTPPPSWQGTLDRCEDLPDRLDVHRPARLGAVEVDQVDPGRPLRLPARGHRRGIVAEDRLLVVIPLPEPDATPSPQVDRRDHLHDLHRNAKKPTFVPTLSLERALRKDRPADLRSVGRGRNRVQRSAWFKNRRSRVTVRLPRSHGRGPSTGRAGASQALGATLQPGTDHARRANRRKSEVQR